jgi:hypothetical protein
VGHHNHDGMHEMQRVIRYCTFSPSGDRIGRPRSVAPVSGGFQSRPSVAVSAAGDVYIAWVELTEKGKAVAVARIPSHDQ